MSKDFKVKNGLQVTTNITASGNISSSGIINSDTLQVSGKGVASYNSGADTIILANSNQKTSLRGVEINMGDSRIFSEGNITASGNISASGLLQTNEFSCIGDAVFGRHLSHQGDSDTKITLETNTISITAGNTTHMGFTQNGGTQILTNLTASGNISASGAAHTFGGTTTLNTTLTTTNKFEKTSNTDANHQGDVVFLGGTTSMDAGKIYHYKSDGTWELADADAVATCDGLLAVALGAASDTNGMLLRGTVTLDHDPGAVGDVLFVSTTAGQATATAPSGNTDIVRVVGYCLDASNGQIWFNPSSTFVEVSA